MAYQPPASVIVNRLLRTFPEDTIRNRAAKVNLTERHRKFDVVPFFWTLVLGVTRGNQRTLQAFLERFVASTDLENLTYTSFRNWFTPTFLDFLTAILDDQITDISTQTRNDQLQGRLARFRDVLVADVSFVPLVQSASDVYTAFHDDHAGAKVHLTKSLSTDLVTRFKITTGTAHELPEFDPGPWVADALILFDLGFYDFSVFDRIDAYGGWFVTRLKATANPKCVEELRVWQGNPVPLEGRSLQDVLGDLKRDVIDIRAEVTLTKDDSPRVFRVVGIRNDTEDRYHLYITNLPRKAFGAPEIAQLYRARWEVELLFKELKSTFGMDKLRVSTPVIIETLILAAALSLVVSRVILDELRGMAAKETLTTAEDSDPPTEVIPPQRGSKVISRHVGLLNVYVLVELGYGWPDLDDVLLEFCRDPNPHRSRLREQVQFEPFPVAVT